MNSYKLLIHLILLYSYFHSSNTKANNWTVAQWEGNIDAREIIVYGKITTLKDSFDQFKSKNEVEDMDSFIYKNPNLVYTALKCKYSDAITDVLQTIYEILKIGYNKYILYKTKNYYVEKSEIKLLEPIIEKLKIIKPNVVKIIYNLFFYWDKYPELRTTDQNLLKSMLSINQFLYHNNNQQPYGQNMKNVNCLITIILQIINLLERFLLKNCYVENPYKNYNTIAKQIIKVTSENADIISTILNPKINYLENLIINGPFTYDGYNEDMYNPEHLLFENALMLNNSMLVNFQTFFKGSSKYLDDHYKNVISNLTYDLEEIFDYQILLIETIIQIFFRQLFYFLTNSNESNYTDNVQIVLKSFVEFSKKIMPNNCLTSACQTAKIFVNLRIYTNKEDKIEFIDNNLQMAITLIKTSLDSFARPLKLTDTFDIKDFSLNILINDMLQNEQYKVFNQTIKLLSYESNTNTSHCILKHSNFRHVRKFDRNEQKVFQLVDNLRIALFSFQQQLNSLFLPTNYQNTLITENSNFGVTESQFERTFNSLKILFYNFEIVPLTQYMLLPLLVYLHNESRINNYDIQLGRILYITINKIESLFLWLNKSPPSNLHTYLETKIVPRYTIELDQEISQKLIIDDLVESNSNRKFIERYQNALTLVYDYNWLCIWPDIDQDKDLQFYWDGKIMFATYLLENFIGRMTVIDHQDLVKVQWLTIKWFLAKVLLKTKYILTEFVNLKNSQSNTIILKNFTKGLKALIELKIPVSVMDSINEMIKLFNIILTDSKNSYIKVAENAIDEYLSMLGTPNTAMDYGSPKNACTRLEIDIQKLQKYLNEIEDKSILYSDLFSFSTILFPV